MDNTNQIDPMSTGNYSFDLGIPDEDGLFGGDRDQGNIYKLVNFNSDAYLQGTIHSLLHLIKVLLI